MTGEIVGFEFERDGGVLRIEPIRAGADDPGTTQPLVHITDHEDRAVRELLSQHQDKPRIVALARALGAGAQAAEDLIFDLTVSRTVQIASGRMLDQWGAIVGQPRGGMSDRDYRRFIFARALANRSRGSADEMIAIFELATDAERVIAEELHPATVRLTAIRQAWMDDRVSRATYRIMRDAKRLGISLVLVEAVPDAFGFDGDDEARGYDEGLLSRIIR